MNIINKLKVFINKQCRDLGNNNPKYEIKSYSKKDFKILVIKNLTLELKNEKTLYNYINTFNKQAIKFGGAIFLNKINMYNQADFEIFLFNDIKDKEEFYEQLKYFFITIIV